MPEPTTTGRIPAPPRGRGRNPRTRLARFAGAVALVLVAATGCVTHQDPTGYNASVRTEFVDGCVTGFKPADGGKDPDATSNRKLCTCIYAELTDKTTGVSFDDFKSAQSAIRKDPDNPANRIDKLIPKFPTYVKTCRSKVVAGP